MRTHLKLIYIIYISTCSLPFTHHAFSNVSPSTYEIVDEKEHLPPHLEEDNLPFSFKIILFSIMIGVPVCTVALASFYHSIGLSRCYEDNI